MTPWSKSNAVAVSDTHACFGFVGLELLLMIRHVDVTSADTGANVIKSYHKSHALQRVTVGVIVLGRMETGSRVGDSFVVLKLCQGLEAASAKHGPTRFRGAAAFDMR
jgi:hypothetical protein